MNVKEALKDLIGIDLREWKIIEMTEVFSTNEDGRKSRSLGFFKDENIATAFAGTQKDVNFHKTEKVIVLCKGTIGFIINEREEVTFVDEESELLKVKEKALAKLSEAERRILRL